MVSVRSGSVRAVIGLTFKKSFSVYVRNWRRSRHSSTTGESITHALDEAFDMIIQTQTIRTGSLADQVAQQADEIRTLKTQVRP